MRWRGLEKRPYLFTKCVAAPGMGGGIHHNLKRTRCDVRPRPACRRLGVDTIDLYQIHWP